jgi:hypothetical protein
MDEDFEEPHLDAFCEEDYNPLTPIERVQRQEKIREFEQEVTRENIEFSRKPTFIQQNEIGDRMSDGSDEQGYDNWKENEDGQ